MDDLTTDDEIDFDLRPNLEAEDAVMHHVILPRVLPLEKSENLFSTEMEIMNQMVKTAKACQGLLPQKTIELMVTLENFHIECTPQTVSSTINRLGPGKNFAMFIRSQHCAIMIHVPPNEKVNDVQNVIVAAFPGCLDSSEIYSHDSDIEFNYPERAIKVKFSKMLRSHEFSQQLCVLNEGLPVGYKRQDCVSKWLTTLLMDDNSTVATKDEFSVITKKIRDEVWGKSDNFFRRSSLYMSAKAMLQHNLTVHLGAGDGKTIYKIFILKFLVGTCAPYEQFARFNIDLLSQVIAKIARRIEKLSNMTITDSMANLYSATIVDAKKTIKKIRKNIDAQIKHKREADDKKSKVSGLTGLDFKSDIQYKIPKLEEYLNKRKQDTSETNNSFKPPKYTSYERFFKSEEMPVLDDISLDFETKNEIVHRTFWMDFERIILYETKIGDDHLSCYDLRKWSFKYAKFAEKNYKDNPLRISRMLLVRLKMIAMLDDQATKEYPLLLEHQSGIKPKIIDHLLLPQSADMRIAFELEEYFCNRERALDPSLIGQKEIDNCSFSVKFAKDDEEMKLIRDEILAKDKKSAEQKKKEWSEGRDKAEQLRSEANRLDCERRSGRNTHSPACKRCLLRRQADDICVKQYEHILPRYETYQFAIVFELKIPDEIACLRDVLYSFAEFCHGEPKILKIRCDWNDRNVISKYNSSKSEYVKLGSTTKQNMDKVTVDKPLKDVILQSTLNCYLHAKNRAMPSFSTTRLVKNVCTFKIHDEYADVQWALYSTQHTENHTLSNQSKCGSALTLSEYKNFGSLRSDGHRLQIRKLYAMIETEALPLEKEAVLLLVMQTLWECEVCGEEDFIRESHIDFRHEKFCKALIEMLEKFVEQQKNNWNHQFKLLTVTLIAVRAFEMNENEDLAKKIMNLLCRVRSIALEWIDKIESCITQMTSADESTERNLRLKLIYVAIIGGLTFFVHPKHKYFKLIFPNNTANEIAVQSWLRFIISLENNVRMYTNDDDQLSPNLRMFLQLMESVGVSLEDKVTRVIDRSSDFIVDVIKKQWPTAHRAMCNNMVFNHNYPQILEVLVSVGLMDQTVTIDIITGSFLVDSLPLSRLPSNVINSDSYRWFFGDVVFEVQPDAQQNFTTIHKYNNCSYEFKMIDDDKIIITERRIDDENKVIEKELIDKSFFEQDTFPYNLVNNYSHWWNKGEEFIEFRQKTVGKQHFSKETTIDYRLSLINKQLFHEQTHHTLLDIKSKSYELITEQLKRLEDSKYIQVSYISENEEVIIAQVELLRMNLKFTLRYLKTSKKHIYLMSNEFKGMGVAHEQKIGTLCGLQNGLILESKDGDKKIMLIPNGRIQIRTEHEFASVKINTNDDLRSPPFYQYQVDKFCCQLKSSNGSHASWFFLAYLHAITSHGEIEPFTGMSGTERAIQILQSAFAWSSSPYEPEAVKILRDIAYLTPLRELVEDIQFVDWPKNIPNRSAQDCFVFIAKKLLDDSQRLRSFYGGTLDHKMDLNTNMKLNERDHYRCQRLNPNMSVTNTFIERKVLKTSALPQNRDSFSDNTRTVCILYHMQQFKVPTNLRLKQFLTGKSEKMLDGIGNSGRVKDILSHCVHEQFRDLWISLYDAAVKRQLNREKFAIILSMYAHRGEDIEPILALQAVATHPNAFQQINPPERNTFQIFAKTFNAKTVHSLIMKRYKKPIQYTSREWDESGERNRHDVKLNTILDDITSTIERDWPCNSCNFTQKWASSFEHIDFEAANAAVNERLKIWYANHQLYEFIKKVTTRFKTLAGFGPIYVQPCLAPPSTPKNWGQTSIDFNAKIGKNIQAESSKQQIEEAKSIWQMNTTRSLRSPKDWLKIYKTMCKSNETNHLIEAGIFPRMVPSLILPKIMDPNVNFDLKCLIGAFAIAITQEQRENRIKTYSQQPSLRAALEREEENTPYENWSPCEYPEWLLFEIEQNLTIRRIQIEIAKRMIQPEGDTKHFVMQLNMGEGKTAVIVPILAAKLADGTQACQIIVLKSLFTRNLKSLRQYLGGLLNRRIYTFPCRRDMPIESHAPEFLNIYEECKREKGIILTLPEYRLSFELKIYESISFAIKTQNDRDYTTAKGMLDLFKWTNENVRTILDESDAILQAKYQLVYTVGNQKQPDGNAQRWLITQAVLKRVPFHMNRLYAELGKEKIEFGNTHNDSYRGDVFMPCRILDETVFDKLKEALIEDLFAERIDIDFLGIEESKKPSLKKALKDKVIDKSILRTIETFSEEKQNIIYILSGLLRFEVLKLALTKRWRVNYGVDVKGPRKMAIPFKAKDVAAENSEFGHPDVAVCFTQMSYYYSGLTEAQLYHVFNLLENSPDAANIYAKWIQSIAPELRDSSIETYSRVNLDDPDQRDRLLFPLFKVNMNVIDFWLSNVVYPHELKVFEKKLMCTAWDLCSEQFKYPVTGFSGTNDTKNILPITIVQNDLAELENTNAEMRQILLDPRNRVYENPTNMTGKEILQELVKREIPVLLDSGALMLELNNKEVAVEWLKLASKYDAAVYFDENDTLQTIDRNGIVIEFDYSVYREDLSNCVVYLDDVHTRGTDLKFPPDSMACVTLSGDITRDKTVQSCMRMRQLKTTQSILFWPSHEAEIRIRKLGKLPGQRRVESKHVMQFIENNSRLFEMANMAHWASGAINYTKKLIGHNTYENPPEDTTDDNKLEKLYNACVDDDYVKLKDMYGEKDDDLLSRIAWRQFSKLMYAETQGDFGDRLIKISKDVTNKLKEKAPEVKRFTHIAEEEQEKELEQEVEEQTQIERPKDAMHAQPKFDRRLEKLVLEGTTDGIFDELKTDGVLLTIPASLANTQMFEFCERNNDAWANHLFVTKDFTILIENQAQACADFLRPVSWVACIKNPDAKDNLILLSSFECNHLMPAFRKSVNSTLFMYRPRLSNHHSNLIRNDALQLSGMTTTNSITVEDEVQIGVYAGSMYFGDEREQSAYCEFLGLIPRPRTYEQTEAYHDGIIEENGYVEMRKRKYPEAVSQCVSQCKFKENPTDLAIKLIKAHHQMLPKSSHVASILNRGEKSLVVDMDIDYSIH